jgi:hypothetical protein
MNSRIAKALILEPTCRERTATVTAPKQLGEGHKYRHFMNERSDLQ